jgi:hypothetical protein
MTLARAFAAELESGATEFHALVGNFILCAILGMRLGADPRTVVTTTPRPTKLIRDLVRDPICVVTRGTSYKIVATWRRHFSSRSSANTKAPGSAGRSSTPSSSKTPRRAVVARFDRGEPAALSTGDDARRRGH